MIEKLYKRQYERTKELVQNPDWYLEFGRARKVQLIGLGAVQAALSGNITQAANYARQQTFYIFEQLLSEHQVRLGIPGQEELDDQDEAREAVSQIVIHHSSRAEGISLTALNALHLINLYVPVYQSKTNPILNSDGNRQPIYSGHFNEAGEQVFYGYHWKVGRDGEAQRLLDDSSLGWHAGNWEINKHSVGICIDDDLGHKSPTKDSLDAVADIIKNYYPTLPANADVIIGHSEASRTICPGDQFIDSWKNGILKRIAA